MHHQARWVVSHGIPGWASQSKESFESFPYSHELSLEVEFVGFGLPVPPPEEAHHPLHSRPPPLPALSPLPLLRVFLVIFIN